VSLYALVILTLTGVFILRLCQAKPSQNRTLWSVVWTCSTLRRHLGRHNSYFNRIFVRYNFYSHAKAQHTYYYHLW